MPRRRHVGPKSYLMCSVCGAAYPVKHGCDCAGSRIVQRVFDLFPGTVEMSADEVRLLQRGSGDERECS